MWVKHEGMDWLRVQDETCFKYALFIVFFNKSAYSTVIFCCVSHVFLIFHLCSQICTDTEEICDDSVFLSVSFLKFVHKIGVPSL